MRILVIFPLCPLPLHSGGQVRIWNICKQLSKRHTLDLVCFIRDESETQMEQELKNVFRDVTFIKRTKLADVQSLSQSPLSFLTFIYTNFVLLFKALFSARPLLSVLYHSENLRKLILDADVSQKYDLFYAETFYGISSLKNDLHLLKISLLLIEENIESKAYERQAEVQTNPLVKQLMLWDVRKIEREEEYFWRSVRFIGGLSVTDNSHIARKIGKPVILLENGVDLEYFSSHLIRRVDDEVLFVGSFKYFQNVDSLRWFVDSILPIIKQPVKVHIVGRGADQSLKEYLRPKGLEIDESVDDIRLAFQHATLLVAPLRAGSGTKYKVLEAMASHLPVITTVVGAEGLVVENGRQLVIAEKAESIASQIDELITSVQKRERLSEAGYQFVQEHYDWRSLVEGFERQLTEVLK